MDVWRYSDWYGLGQEVRYSHPHLWHWRDWIIASLNADKGYDRMVLEMLAGDELAPDDPDTVRATGFLARNWDIFNRNVWLASTVEHTSRAFLGLTIQCARCHDHKFDPISQVDYYRLRAFFEPYHVRVDRVPGESDRVKAGLPRAFDDFLDRPTYLFIRGEEIAARHVASAPARDARRAGRRGPHRTGPPAPDRLLPRQAAVRHRRGSGRGRSERRPRPDGRGGGPPTLRAGGEGTGRRRDDSTPRPRPTSQPPPASPIPTTMARSGRRGRGRRAAGPRPAGGR